MGSKKLIWSAVFVGGLALAVFGFVIFMSLNGSRSVGTQVAVPSVGAHTAGPYIPIP